MKRSHVLMTVACALGLSLTLVLLWLMGTGLPTAHGASPHYVAPGANCGGGNTPCHATLQEAVDAANTGDVIKVAAGTYSDIHSRPAPSGYFNQPAGGLITQVAYINKTVIIRGGYTITNWNTSYPVSQPTILDAQRQGRVMVIAGNIAPTIENLQIIRGDATGLGGGPNSITDHAGGGFYVLTATAAIRNNQILNNTGRGGGAYLQFSSSTLAGNNISGNDTDRSGAGVFLYQSPATIRGNTMTSNTVDPWGLGGGGIYVYKSSATLSENIIHSNAAPRGGGAYLVYSAANLVNNIIADNRLDASMGVPYGSGVAVVGASPKLVHTTIGYNTGGDGSGIHVADITELSVTTYSHISVTNIILVNQAVGITVTTGATNTADLNGVLWFGSTHNTGGPGLITVTNDFTGTPSFVNAAAGDYHLRVTSQAINRAVDAGVTIDVDNQPRPMDDIPDLGADEYSTGCFARVGAGVVVSTVQAAVDSASAGDTVKVAGYCAGDTVYVNKSLTIQGGYTTTDWSTPNATAPATLDAKSGGRVIYASADVTLANLVFQNGNISGSGSTCPGAGCGGGVYADDVLTLNNVAVLSNTARYHGGGVYAQSALVMSDASFINNTSSSASGGGVYANGSATVTGGHFTNNRSSSSNGGGLRVNGALALTGTRFFGNSALNCGGLYHANGQTGRVVNTLFARNSASANAAAMYLNGTVDILHTTVASPTLAAREGIYVTGGTVNIVNTIVASHTTGIQRVSGTVSEDYSLFFGNGTNTSAGVTTGANSLTGNPAFADLARDDYHVASGSAAVDNGTAAGVTTDYEGDARPQGYDYDIGYDESPLAANSNPQINKVVSSALLDPGKVVTYTLIIVNSGPFPAVGVVITDLVPAQVIGVHVISSGISLNDTGVTPGYVWRTPVLGAGQQGLITITGVVSEPLAAGVVFTNTATISTVSADNDPGNNRSEVAVRVNNAVPVANDDTYHTDEDTALVVAKPGVLSNDRDPNGSPLTAARYFGPSTGTLKFNADGSFVYTPTLNFNGVVTFTYRASDGSGAQDSNPATVTIMVLPTNDPPAFTSTPVTKVEPGAQYTYTVVAADVDGSDVLIITNVTMPSWLNFFPVGNGTAILTGIAPQIGDYPVVLQVRDQDGLTGTQSFTVYVRHLIYLPLTLNSYPRP
jgi:uncharacterized repeat protein (TIGR01451 family)